MFDYSVKFRAIDDISRVIDKINSKMDSMKKKSKEVSDKLSNGLDRAGLSASKMSSKLEKAGKALENINRKSKDLMAIGAKGLAVGGSVLYTMSRPLEVARQYELAFKDVKKSVDGTSDELNTLRERMKSFRGASFEELSQITAEAGKMGFNASKVMDFTESVLKGAKALDFNAEMAVGQVGKILAMTNQMNDAVNATKDIMDKVAILENKMAGVKAGGIIDIWKRNADIYQNLGFDNSVMSGMSAFLEQSFVSSELGATGFKVMINRFKRLESELGFISKIKTKGIEGLAEAIQTISKMSQEQQIKKFGSEAMTMIDKLLNSENFNKLTKAIEISKNSMGAVDKEWAFFMATYDQRVKDMQKKTSNLMDAVGTPIKSVVSELLGKINPIIEKITQWVEKNKELTKTIVKWGLIMGGIVAVLATLTLAVGAIGLALGGISSVVGVVVGAFGAFGTILAVAKTAMIALNVVLVANPIGLVTLAITALVGALVGVIVYWKELKNWVSQANIRLKEFIDSHPIIKSVLDGIRAGFDALIAPIRYVTGLVDSFMDKFNSLSKIKKTLSNTQNRIKESVASGWSSVKEMLGIETKEEKSINVSPAKTHIEVTVRAEKGTEALASVKKGKIHKLNTVYNGID